MDKDNMPMILTGSGELTANIVDAAKKGAFWDLREFLKDSESYPCLLYTSLPHSPAAPAVSLLPGS